MSSKGEYYGVEKIGSDWYAMYDYEQHLMGPSFNTEAEAQAFVDKDIRENQTANPTPTPSSEQELEAEVKKVLQYRTRSAAPIDTHVQSIMRLIKADRLLTAKEARIDENEYWREVSKSLQRGMLPTDFKSRKVELQVQENTDEA